MDFPPMIDVQKFYLGNKFDVPGLILYAYLKFKNDFIDNGVYFEGKRVYAHPKLLDCTNCGHICTNNFECSICPWISKEDIFQHITSDEDENLILTEDYLASLPSGHKPNKRIPGLFNKDRTIKVPWIKYLIEGVNCSDVLFVKKRDKNNKRAYKIKIFNKSLDYMVILTLVEYKDGNSTLYLSSQYSNPPVTFLKDFNLQKRNTH